MFLLKLVRRAKEIVSEIWLWIRVQIQRLVNLLLQAGMGVRDAAVHMFDLLLGIALIIVIREILASEAVAGFQETLLWLGGSVVGWYATYRLWHRIQPRNIAPYYNCLRELYRKLPEDVVERAPSLRIAYFVPSKIAENSYFQLTPYFPQASGGVGGGRGRFIPKSLETFESAVECSGGEGEDFVLELSPDPEAHERSLVARGMPRHKLRLAREGVTINLLAAVVGCRNQVLGILYMDACEWEPLAQALLDPEDRVAAAVAEAKFTLRALDDPDWRLPRGSYHTPARN